MLNCCCSMVGLNGITVPDDVATSEDCPLFVLQEHERDVMLRTVPRTKRKEMIRIRELRTMFLPPLKFMNLYFMLCLLVKRFRNRLR